VEKINVLLDEDIHASLGLILRRRGFDVEHVQESGRKGVSDPEQLAYAVEGKRCLITFNVKHFVLLHNEYVNSEREHWGIIVSKQLPIGEMMRRVLKILQRHSQVSMKNRLLFL
jgi:hypothetical protein